MDCEWIGFCALKAEAQAAWVQAIASIIALATAIGVSIAEGRRQRRVAKLSARPLISIGGYMHSEPPRLLIRMKNSGLGPAIVTKHEVRLDGHAPPTDVRREAFWLDLSGYLEGLGQGYAGGEVLFEGMAVSAGETVDLLDIKFREPPDGEKVHEQVARLSIDVEYVSIFDEQFTARFNADDWRTPSAS